MYFFKNFLLFSGAWIRLSKYMIMMTKVGSTKILNFPGQVLGRDGINHTVKMHYFFRNIILYFLKVFLP